MIPFERDIYVAMLLEYLEREKERLANSEQYKNVVKHLNSENSMLIYVNMPLANNSLKDFLDAEAKKDIAKNKHYFEAFPTFAFQLTANGDGFDTKVLIDYEEQEQLKELKSDFIKDASEKAANNNATSLMSADENGEDSLEISIQDIEEAALIQIDELILEDLDAKIQVENYPSGAIKLEVGLKNGVKNGSYTEYSEDGKVIVKGSFKNDQKTGVWKFYDKNGGLISKKKF